MSIIYTFEEFLLINELWIIDTNGMCFFHKSTSEAKSLKGESVLLGGFFSAIITFSHELSGRDIKRLETQKAKILFFKEGNLIFIVGADVHHSEKKIRQRIKIIKNLFINKYRDELISFDGDISKFKKFEDDLENVFTKISKIDKWGKAILDL
ncbi:MAG: hypothetical protein JW891_14240 [Candidatus Lokiarchaeota archaeon]|nr:hypothetical protein [Candidatus Lokiarchaeota archaeon]